MLSLIHIFIKSFDPKGIWIRYVDDGLYVSSNKNTNADNILKQINNIYSKIQFTEEKEKHNKINYLDITITRNNNHIQYAIYRKPTSANIIIPCLLYTSRCV